MSEKWSPKSHSEPEISVYADGAGFVVTVGYSIDKHWYPCRREYARSERAARRKAKWLLKWYRAYVKRDEKADRIQAEFERAEGQA